VFEKFSDGCFINFDDAKVSTQHPLWQSTKTRVFFSPKKGILLFFEKNARKMAKNGQRFGPWEYPMSNKECPISK